MTTRAPRPIAPEADAEIAAMIKGGTDMEVVLVRMRVLGLNKIECMKMLRAHAAIPSAEGKDLVQLSRAWSDRFESDEALHDAMEQSIQVMFAEDVAAA